MGYMRREKDKVLKAMDWAIKSVSEIYVPRHALEKKYQARRAIAKARYKIKKL